MTPTSGADGASAGQAVRATGKSVLAVGLEPGVADLTAHPDLSLELVRAFIDQQIERVRDLGHHVDTCLIARTREGEDAVAEMIQSRRYDCIVIGAGIREPSSQLLFFEALINIVHRLAPTSTIAFNSTPADTAEAVQRWLAG